MDSWWFRTKPRSILKTIEWFPHFADLEGENWELKLEDKVSSWGNKSIYPIRRRYIYNAHYDDLETKYSSYEDYMSGNFDVNETESTGRNDKTTYEFYGLGYVDSQGKIKSTKTGNIIKEGRMDEDILLKLLLKIQFPSPAIHKNKEADEPYVFPMEVILNIYKHFESLNRFELSYLFMCNDINSLNISINAIKEFRKKYDEIENKNKLKNIVIIFTEIMNKYFPNITNQPETYYRDYSDALIRTLEYTGLFSQRGRGYFVKLFVPEHSKIKFKLLQEQYVFKYNDEDKFESYMEWFGDPYNIDLPWEHKSNIRTIIENKIYIYKERLKEAEKNITNFEAKNKLDNIEKLEKSITFEDDKQLRELDRTLSEILLSLNEELFVMYYSKTDEAREEIIDKFIDILEGNEDMAALWLECNTWKSLVAIDGKHYVKRNFKIEEDLTPKAFAPGVGNTPDMELYKNGYIIIPEVSLMTGVKQWEHEGSSVIEHVFKFIQQYEDKQVLGLFISSSMNVRTIWQFYILNRESWIGKPVPVVPIKIKQYIEIIKIIYSNNLSIDDFKELIETIHKNTFKYNTFKEWEDEINNVIDEWENIKTKRGKIYGK
ncbi:hypothetical protein SDC9_53761 [bioreactor metagenome]|uniref:AlwI restriction endonuclease n=1 Tax=bioreactor metagenome TaxID=1076179 RepID=A0A644WU44_9ZZZZ